jgi:hypothetical protein
MTSAQGADSPRLEELKISLDIFLYGNVLCGHAESGHNVGLL